MYLNIILNFFILLIQIANCLNCKGNRQKKEFKKIFVKKFFQITAPAILFAPAILIAPTVHIIIIIGMNVVDNLNSVPPAFSPLVFFFKQLLLAPVDKRSNDFDIFEYSRRYSTFPVHRRCQWHRGCKRFYYSWMILSNFECTLLRSNIYWWLVCLLIVPLNALANCQRSYWCINGVIDTGEVGDIYCPVSMMHDVTGVNDTYDMLRQCHWHRQIHASPVSLTPANACFAGVNDTGEEFFDGIVDTGEAL